MTSGIVWVDKGYLRLVNECLEYHQPIITNPLLSQKSLHSKLTLILPRVSEVRIFILRRAKLCDSLDLGTMPTESELTPKHSNEFRCENVDKDN